MGLFSDRHRSGTEQKEPFPGTLRTQGVRSSQICVSTVQSYEFLMENVHATA
jgi:hypothetical protein